MCGIYGFRLNRELSDQDIESGRSALKKLHSRGPDGKGVWWDKYSGIFLGHTRLKVIDTSEASSQPMVSGKDVIVYNGELYNYLEMRSKLRHEGISFQTSGDTEVFMKGFKSKGIDFLLETDAMFSFAFFDGCKLSLGTDVFGEKPLFYLQNQEGFFFSSEPQVLINQLNLQFDPTPEEITSFLCVGLLLEDATGYPGLKRTPPGTLLTIGPNNTLNKKKYYKFPKAFWGSGKIEQLNKSKISEIKECLINSTSKRLRSDVPLGLFLSGGVDSALIAALATKELDQDIKAYTVAFPDGVDESNAAKGISKHLNIEHETLSLDNERHDTRCRQSRELAELFNIPMDNLAALSVAGMAKAMKQHATVALTGAGGDEIFWGYNKYMFSYKRERVIGLLPFFFDLIRGKGLIPGKLRKLAEVSYKSKTLNFLSLKNKFHGSFLKELPAIENVISKVGFDEKGDSLSYLIRDFDLRNTLPFNYIPGLEFPSMREGVETRSPFLSKDLVELVAGVDQRSLIHFGLKNVLRAMLKEYVPSTLLTKGKQGFIAPLRNESVEIHAKLQEHLSQRNIEGIHKLSNDVSAQMLLIRINMLSRLYGQPY